MSDETYRVTGKVTLDTAAAGRAARDHKRDVDALRAANTKLADEERKLAAETEKLRKAQLNVMQADISGTQSKRELAMQTKIIRLESAKLTDATKAVREEKRRLQAEERALQSAMRDTARAAQESARAQVQAAREAARAEAQIVRDREAAARARRRGEDLAAREAPLGRAMSAADKRIEAAQERLGETRSRLARLGRPLGGVRTAVEDGARARFDRFKTGEGLGEAAGQLGGGLRSIAGAGAGLLAGGGAAVVGAAGGIAAVGGEFEKLRASLETIEGSKTKAEATFKTIQDFARTTPNSLAETTTALLKLKARGLDSSLPALRAYGDTAAAMGKSLDEMVEAVADATTGEFERLKEFGIKASTEGDKVKLTFKGVTTTVQKDSKSIEQYLVKLGQTNFAGGMERQSQTLLGQLGGLSDTLAQLADEAFRNGLGDAIKEVVADMSGLAGEGGDLAKVIGKTLGDAVRGAYKWFKEFIGPIDQLDEKFQAAWKMASEFVGVVTTAVGVVTSLASSLGGANTALVAIGAGLVALTGPLGAVAALGATLGATLVRAFSDSGAALAELHRKADEVRQKEFEAEKRAIQQEIDQTRRENEQITRANDAGRKVRETELRRLGKSVDQLSPEERAALRSKVAGTISGLLGQGASGGRAFGGGDFESRMAAFDASSKDLSLGADRAEFDRLNKRRKSLSPSEKKRLGELSKELDVNVARGGGKAKLDAFDAARKKEIDDLVKRAELDAADKALASGDAAGAGRAARQAGKETRARLKDMASKGALPGEVERALLRQAGFEDVQNAPPPPVIVYQQTFNQTVYLQMDATVTATGDPETVADELGEATQTKLERDILPRTADLFRSAIRR